MNVGETSRIRRGCEAEFEFWAAKIFPAKKVPRNIYFLPQPNLEKWLNNVRNAKIRPSTAKTQG